MTIATHAEGDNTLLGRVAERLATTWAPLPDKPEETIDLTARALWFFAYGDPRSVVRAGDGELPTLNDERVARLWELVEMRQRGVPLAHITGRQNFMGLELLSTGEALIPRRETEILARAAIALLDAVPRSRESRLAIDVCTGSGNVALALAKHDCGVRLVGADLSPEAVSLANRNAAHVGLADRAQFIVSDLFVAYETPEFLGRTDVITCNPPYVSSAKVPEMHEEIARYEPRLAFDGGALCLSIISRLLSDAPRFLRPGCSVAFEVGVGLGRYVSGRARKSGVYSDVREIADDAGVTRVIVATVPGAST
jgi:release factor glutamine methyltransferase